jgi:hypothetical protein
MNNPKYKKIDYLLGTYYHQDIWDEYKTHEEIWQSFVQSESSEVVNQLREEVGDLLDNQGADPDSIHKIILNKEPHGLWFNNSEEAKKWFEDLNKFISSAKN